MSADRHSDADLQVIDRLLAAAERAEAEARAEAEGLRLARQRRLRELDDRSRALAATGTTPPAPASTTATAGHPNGGSPLDGVPSGISPKAAAWLLPRIEGSLGLADAVDLDRDALVARIRAAERESELASVSDALSYLQGRRRANGAEG